MIGELTLRPLLASPLWGIKRLMGRHPGDNTTMAIRLSPWPLAHVSRCDVNLTILQVTFETSSFFWGRGGIPEIAKATYRLDIP
jgi:hypothetical protein